MSRPQRAQPAGSLRLLRYRFDTVDQVCRHFHVASGRVVLFYPCLLALRPTDPVLLDVSFAASDQHCPVRGMVISRDTGGNYVGWWLEFAAAGLVSSLRSATAIPKRRQRRFPTEVLINVERGEGMPVVAKLVDVGLGGGRIGGASIRAMAGDKVRLSLFSRDTGAPFIGARVAWVRAPEIGVEFDKPSPAERAAIASLTQEARQKLADSYEAMHPSFCRCSDGNAVAEPPLPRAAHRQTGSR